MVWRAGGGGPMRRCISSTGNLYAYSYPNNENGSGSGSGSGHSPIPIARAGTPPVLGMGLSTSPGSLHAFHSVMTPPMNSPRGGQLQPMAPFERTWGDDVVRVVCISDTHSRHDALLRAGLLPPGDVLVHAGDFSTTGTRPQVENFRDFLKTVPYAHKVVVGGNHDITLHDSYYEEAGEERFHKGRPDGPYFPAEMRRMLTNLEGEFSVRYLENEAVEVMGVTFWGTPWTPYYAGWAFNYEPEGEFCRELYASIPENVDVLITHGPPAGVGDLTVKGVRAGCPVLLNEVRSRIRPRTHVFGHIHEGYGAYEDELGWTKYCNASTSTIQYRPINPPLVFDVPLDRSQPTRWVSVPDEEVTRLDLRDGVARPMNIRRHASAFSLASSSNTDLAAASSAASSASSSSSASASAAAASAAATLATAALRSSTGAGGSSSSLAAAAGAGSSSSLGQPPRSPKTPQKPVLPGRTMSLPAPPVSALTAGLAAAAASGPGSPSPSQPIVVSGASEGSAGSSGRARERGDRESIGDSMSMGMMSTGGDADASSVCSGGAESVLTTGTGGLSLPPVGQFTPSSSLDLEVEVAERFMSLRVQQQGQGGAGAGAGATVVEMLQSDTHIRISSGGGHASAAAGGGAGAGAGAGSGAGAREGGEAEAEEEASASSSSPAPALAPLSSTPPLTRFAVGRRLR